MARPRLESEDQRGAQARTAAGNKYDDDNQGGVMPSWMVKEESNREENKNRDLKKKPAQLKKKYIMLHKMSKSKRAPWKESVLLDQFWRGLSKNDKIHPLKVKEAMSTVDKSTKEDLQKRDCTLKKCSGGVGKPIFRENYVGEFYMKNVLHFRKHQEMKTVEVQSVSGS